MILLFAGSTPIIRAALAEKIVDDFPMWRHLAMEDLSESAVMPGGKEFDPKHLFMIACSCAQTMQDEGYHLILSITDATDFLPMLRRELEGDLLSVYLGDPKESAHDDYDHVIDTSAASIKDIYTFLEPLIANPPNH